MKHRGGDRIVFSRVLAPDEAVHYVAGDTYSVREPTALAMAEAGVATLIEGSDDLRERFDAAAAPVCGEPPTDDTDLANLD